MKQGVKSQGKTAAKQLSESAWQANHTKSATGASKKIVARKSVGKKKLDGETKPKQTPEQRGGGVARWLGGAARLKQDIRSDLDVIRASEAGITKTSVEELGRRIGVSKKDMAEKVLHISVKTLERKDPSDKLDKKISSHVLEIAKVMQHAFEVFEQEEKAKLWLNRENRTLNDTKPVQLLDTLTGINMVNEVLTRIEEGVYS